MCLIRLCMLCELSSLPTVVRSILMLANLLLTYLSLSLSLFSFFFSYSPSYQFTNWLATCSLCLPLTLLSIFLTNFPRHPLSSLFSTAISLYPSPSLSPSLSISLPVSRSQTLYIYLTPPPPVSSFSVCVTQEVFSPD